MSNSRISFCPVNTRCIEDLRHHRPSSTWLGCTVSHLSLLNSLRIVLCHTSCRQRFLVHGPIAYGRSSLCASPSCSWGSALAHSFCRAAAHLAGSTRRLGICRQCRAACNSSRRGSWCIDCTIGARGPDSIVWLETQRPAYPRHIGRNGGASSSP